MQVPSISLSSIVIFPVAYAPRMGGEEGMELADINLHISHFFSLGFFKSLPILSIRRFPSYLYHTLDLGGVRTSKCVALERSFSVPSRIPWSGLRYLGPREHCMQSYLFSFLWARFLLDMGPYWGPYSCQWQWFTFVFCFFLGTTKMRSLGSCYFHYIILIVFFSFSQSLKDGSIYVKYKNNKILSVQKQICQSHSLCLSHQARGGSEQSMLSRSPYGYVRSTSE